MTRFFRLKKISAAPCALSFERFQIGNDVRHLAGVELEFRHARVASNDPFSQRFLQTLDRVSFMQGAKRRRYGQRAIADAHDRMALRAMNAYEDQSSLRRRRKRLLTVRKLRHKG